MSARIVIAGVSSGVGKTTATVGLCRALQARGLRVALFKCGPDYLDPTYHQRAAGRPGQNIDGWLMGREAVVSTVARAEADVVLIEGVMGLFDGASPTGPEGSTAEIARWLDAPVLLVIDAGGMARSFAALAAGFVAFDPALAIGGLVANRVGSRGHLDLLRRAQTDPPILGGLPVRADLAFPERHLGLRTADATIPDAHFDGWGRTVEEWWNVDLILALAHRAPPLSVAVPAAVARPRRCRIGLAFDEAFHFYYDENLVRLTALGAELVRFSPLHDQCLPEVDGLYIGGGYPEIHAEALTASPMRADIAAFARRGGPLYAECGGLMYLSDAIRTLDGSRHPMVGLISGEAVMASRLEALGYVEVETQTPSPLGAAGTRFRGHEFRYSRLETGVPGRYRVRRRRGGEPFVEGYGEANVVGSYVHAHWASNPEVPAAFIAACTRP